MRGIHFKRLALFFVVILSGRLTFADGEPAKRCLLAYESNPLSYREPNRFAHAIKPVPFDPATFRTLEEDGPQLKSVLETQAAARPEEERALDLTVTMIGRWGVSLEQRQQRLNKFWRVTRTMTDVRRHKSELDAELVKAVAMDATAKAARYLRDSGIDTEIHYSPVTGEAYITAGLTGNHPVNQAARAVSRAKLPLAIAYRPMIRLEFGSTAMLDPSNVFYVADQSLLTQTVKDPLVLHELRHWKNIIGRADGEDYALSGVSGAVEGSLPGPRDSYSEYTSHDEPHAWFETLKQYLIQAASDAKMGREVNLELLIEAARTGYRASYRVEAIARLLLQTDPAIAKYSREANDTVLAQKPFQWGRHVMQSSIPLTGLKPEATDAEMQAEFRRQLEWMRDAARETKTQFDRAHIVLQTIKGRPTLDQIRSVQSLLKPINYTRTNL